MLESVTTTHLSGPWWAAPPFLMRGEFSPLAFLPPFPIASGSGGYPRVFNPLRQPAGLRLEPGLGTLGEEPSPGICMCTFVYWKRREGHSSQWPFHSPCSQPPVVPTEACRPVQADAFISVLSLPCCGSQSVAERTAMSGS